MYKGFHGPFFGANWLSLFSFSKGHVNIFQNFIQGNWFQKASSQCIWKVLNAAFCWCITGSCKITCLDFIGLQRWKLKSCMGKLFWHIWSLWPDGWSHGPGTSLVWKIWLLAFHCCMAVFSRTSRSWLIDAFMKKNDKLFKLPLLNKPRTCFPENILTL